MARASRHHQADKLRRYRLLARVGVGKTAIAEEIRGISGIQPLETDRIRKVLAGLDPEQPAPADPGEGIYTQSMTHAS